MAMEHFRFCFCFHFHFHFNLVVPLPINYDEKKLVVKGAEIPG